MNRLAAESSPYLLQHAANPVDWYPWGEEALNRAQAEDKPILLSIGYAACHWCHVMEHESFENAQVAAQMNAGFVCIKVDREERPDVDAVYMDAVQAMGVRGGWPLHVFLAPDGRPFYGLTYAPPGPWQQLLGSVANAWTNHRPELLKSADQFTQALRADELRKFGLGPVQAAVGDPAALDAAFYHFQESFDTARGGLDRAPKFPMPAHYAWLVRYHARTGHALALDHTLLTLHEMARGGLFDQIGGGWARYSVDADWLVPHFEKMLYDNGQLLTAYAEAFQLRPDEELRQALTLTLDWVEKEMLALTGGAYASLDADSEGMEGRFYVWTWAELDAALSDAELPVAAAYWRCTPAGNWEHGYNILHRRGSDAQFVATHGLTDEELRERVAEWSATLRAHRRQRVRPGLDDKLLTGWNGLLLRGLADTHRALADEQSLRLALQVGEWLADTLTWDGEQAALRRNLKPGGAATAGFLEDYAAVAWGLVGLFEITFEPRWLRAADGVLAYALAHFADAEQPTGLLFYTDEQSTALIARKKELFDNVIPASNSLLARALRQVGLQLGKTAYLDRARQLLGVVRPLVEKEPNYLANWAALYEELLTPGYEVVIIGPDAEAYRQQLQRHFLPGVVVAGASGYAAAETPLLVGKTAVGGRTTLYVCFEGACQQPAFSVEDALAQLQAVR